MSSVQITASGPYVKVRNIPPSRCFISSWLCIAPIYTMTSQRLVSNKSSYSRCNTMCSFGGERKSENGNESSPWKSLEQAVQGFRKKELSVQDILREQMQKREFSDDVGGGVGNPPGGSRGGGGGGGGFGGGSEDEGLAGVLDETVQVVLATLGFMFLYYYILQGEEVTRLIKDIFKYIFTKTESVRLKRLRDDWEASWQHITRREEVPKDWLERAIVNTPTWWHKPARVKRELGYRLASGYYDK